MKSCNFYDTIGERVDLIKSKGSVFSGVLCGHKFQIFEVYKADHNLLFRIEVRKCEAFNCHSI